MNSLTFESFFSFLERKLVCNTTQVVYLLNQCFSRFLKKIIKSVIFVLMGTLQMMGGAMAMGIVSLFANGKPLPMVAGMAAGSLTGVALTWLTLGGKAPAGPQPVRTG